MTSCRNLTLIPTDANLAQIPINVPRRLLPLILLPFGPFETQNHKVKFWGLFNAILILKSTQEAYKDLKQGA